MMQGGQIVAKVLVYYVEHLKWRYKRWQTLGGGAAELNQRSYVRLGVPGRALHETNVQNRRGIVLVADASPHSPPRRALG